MTKTRLSTFPITVLFLVAALYDGALGVVFFATPGELFRHFDVTPPNHMGYVQFPALLLLIFAFMFIEIAVNPVANRRLMLYGALLKASYSFLTFGYWLRGGVPWMWKPFAVIDFIMMVLFVLAYFAVSARGRADAPIGPRRRPWDREKTAEEA